ncbi:MAG: hypothetical protein KAU01_02050 [Candidatus Cloacimonetes bacterium]|nr:hypothetical protein [Candidatus Cloacimonadota bacterium]
MKYLKNKIVILLILTLFVSSCAIFTKPDKVQKEKLLLEHLNSWKSFRIEGIIEVNYKSFAFRNNIILQKNNNIFRIDIFDSGITGLKPTPFFSAYFDSVLVLRLPDQSESTKIENAELKNISIIFNNLQDFYSQKDEIIENQFLIFKNYEVYFSDKMGIEKISFQKEKIDINFKYDNDLDFISIEKDKKEVVNIQIDKITRNNIEIKPLK